MKALYAEFTAVPGREHELAELVRQLTVDVRNEPGNVAFEPFTRADAPRSYIVFEIYRDDDAFEAHLASAHSRAFNARLSTLIEGTASTLKGLDPLA